MKNKLDYFNEYKEKLYNLLVFAKENVGYYRENWSFNLPDFEDFSLEFFENVIPFLEKKEVRSDSERFIIDGFEKKKLSIDSTSGTEGKPIICYRSEKERFQCSNSLWKMRRRFVKDLRPSDKFARFYAFRNVNKEIVADKVLYKDNDILLPLFNLSDEKLIYYWTEIVKFKPRWLHGPSSTIFNLAEVVKKYNLPKFSFEFVELSGEYVDPNHKKTIEEVFSCKTANQYGCREYWPMAYTNLDGDLQVITENIFIEEIYNDGHKQNEILITLLKNNTWPLIRYKLEDLGNLIYIDDQLLLFLERGRKADFFTLKGNRRFNAIIFSGLARSICELYGLNIIKQFQVKKIDDSTIHISLKLEQVSNKNEVKERYKEEISNIVGNDISILIEEKDYIEPDVKTGKTKEFIDLSK